MNYILRVMNYFCIVASENEKVATPCTFSQEALSHFADFFRKELFHNRSAPYK